MKTAIFITAKVGSSRLPSKHFQPVGNKPIMQYLIDRINHRFDYDMPIYIVTGNEKENKQFSTFDDCKVFYGSDRNIPERHLQAEDAHSMEHVIAVDGDDILCSPEAMSYVAEMLDRMDCVKTEGLPLGINCFGYRASYLRESMRFLDKRAIIETGWTRVFPNMTKMVMKSKDRPYLRFTLDYPRDLRFFDKVIRGLGPLLMDATDEDVIEYVLRTKAYKENEALAEDYMKHFQQGKDAE